MTDPLMHLILYSLVRTKVGGDRVVYRFHPKVKWIFSLPASREFNLIF